MADGCGGCEVRKDGIIVPMAPIVRELTSFFICDGLELAIGGVNNSNTADSSGEEIGAEIGRVDAIW